MDFSGRVSRRSYIIAQLFLIPLIDLVIVTLSLALWNLDHDFPQSGIPQLIRGTMLARPTTLALLVVSIAAAIVLVVASLSFTVRRLHDLDFSGWFCLLWPMLRGVMLTPTDAAQSSASYLAFEVVLMMVPGISDPNIYGLNPRSTSGAHPAASRA